MNPETIKAIKEAIEPLAAKLGTTAEATWPIVVAQQKVDAITNGIWALALLITAIGSYNWFIWAMARDMTQYASRYSDVTVNVQAIIAGCITGLALIGALVCLTTIVEKILNPEFQALDYFVQMITGSPDSEN